MILSVRSYSSNPGQIGIICPSPVVKYSRAQIRPADASSHPGMIKHTLAGNWFLPNDRIEWLDVIARTERKGRPCFSLPVYGAAKGGFSGEMFIGPANKHTSVRFEGRDFTHQLMFRTGYYDIWAQLVDEPPAEEPIVDFPNDLTASISKTVNRDQANGRFQVAVWLDVKKVPDETEKLSLAFITDKGESLRAVHDWQGSREYCFGGMIPTGHGVVEGQPPAEELNVGTMLRAFRWQKNEKEELEMLELALFRDHFTVYQSKMSEAGK
jgi:hypothetical protein